MRTKIDLPGSTNQRGTEKLGMPRIPLSNMPLEWLDAGTWRLPSGKALAEFALQAGFLAPLLFKAQRFGGAVHGPEDRGSLAATTIRTKQFGKAGGR